MSDSCNPMDYSLPVSSVHGILQATPLHWSGLPFPSPGDLPIPGIEPGSPALQADSLLIQLVFPTQGSNPALPCCRWILYQLGHQGSPIWCIQNAKIKQQQRQQQKPVNRESCIWENRPLRVREKLGHLQKNKS